MDYPIQAGGDSERRMGVEFYKRRTGITRETSLMMFKAGMESLKTSKETLTKVFGQKDFEMASESSLHTKTIKKL